MHHQNPFDLTYWNIAEVAMHINFDQVQPYEHFWVQEALCGENARLPGVFIMIVT